MAGIGTLVNAVLIIVGSIIGLLFKKAVPEKIKTSLIHALALCTMAIGLTGIVQGSLAVAKEGLTSRFTIVMIMSMISGTLIGELLDIDSRLNKFGDFLQTKLSKVENSHFARGFVTATLTFCVGSMAIVGSLNDGIIHDPSVLIAKGMLDGVLSVVYASTLGLGTLFSFVSVAVYQGLITLFASVLAPFLTDTVISQMSLVGSLLIFGIGLNFVYSPNLRLANMLPAAFMPLVWHILTNIFA